jgi:hypothetical protein
MPGIMGLGGSSTHKLGAAARTDLNPARLTEGFCRTGIFGARPAAADGRRIDKALKKQVLSGGGSTGL